MEVNVRVTVDLGDRTMSLLGGVMAANSAITDATNTCSRVLEKYADPTPAAVTAAPQPEAEAPQPEKPARTRRTKEQIAADNAAAGKPQLEEPAAEPVKVSAPTPQPDPSVDFDDLEDAEKLDALRDKVAEYTKKGKSADIRFILAQFDARSISQAEPLDPKHYGDFYAALERYGKGESVTDIFPEMV